MRQLPMLSQSILKSFSIGDVRTPPLSPLYSGGRGVWGEGRLHRSQDGDGSASDTQPPHPYPSPPEYRGRGIWSCRREIGRGKAAIAMALLFVFGTTAPCQDFVQHFQGAKFDKKFFYFEGPNAQEYITPEA